MAGTEAAEAQKWEQTKCPHWRKSCNSHRKERPTSWMIFICLLWNSDTYILITVSLFPEAEKTLSGPTVTLGSILAQWLITCMKKQFTAGLMEETWENVLRYRVGGRRRQCSPFTLLVSNPISWVVRKEEDRVFTAVGKAPGGIACDISVDKRRAMWDRCQEGWMD